MGFGPLGKLGAVERRRPPAPLVLGRFGVGPKSYGVQPASFAPRKGYGTTPALTGLFRDGRLTVGISQINAMATHINRGGGG
jgi:hypothetical protein